ncbi:LPS export ABC transporter periplasmic protein LptC [Kordiimonas aquimaris]|uniref:LPS export ABC transporter periplasmic protein LptC n=1 Tax=Kordiimonas aquimaris TaxID=707591 RepID=UPI0021CEDB71|nr:LPS export ABC transporter periplasmic protein LptC [Kordiimonas aquimaris]
MNKAVKDHYTSPEQARALALANLRPENTSQHISQWDAFIRFMQIFLPVGAVILGLVTAGWPLLNDTEVSFTLSQDDVARSDDIIRMTNMRYVGTDTKDRLFRIHATAGEQDNPNAPRVRLSNIDAEMELGPNNPATVTARTGIYRTKDNSLSLVGGVNLATGNGYSLEMAGAEVDLKTRTATGQGAVKGQSELGELTAARMALNVEAKEAVFDGGVNVHIVPKRP